MTKTEFEKLLYDEGYLLEENASYPSVVVDDKKSVRSVYRQVKARAKESGYLSSFAVKVKRAGVSTYSNPAAAPKDDAVVDEDVDVMAKDSVIPDLEPAAKADVFICEPVAECEDTATSDGEPSDFTFDFFKNFGDIGA